MKLPDLKNSKDKKYNKRKKIITLNTKKKQKFHKILKIIILIISLFILTIRFPLNKQEGISFNINIINNTNKRRKRLSRRKTLIKGRNYLYKCLDGIFLNNQSFIISNEPKITAIIPVYNCEKTLKPSLRSIQNQKMTDIEIILVNDFSSDNTLQTIKGFQKEDPRIKIINNEKNMGILYSRCTAVLEAKGKYILNLDQDDFFLDENVFNDVYKEAEEGNFDIISFLEVEIKSHITTINEIKNGPLPDHSDNLIVRQPELSHFALFKNGYFDIIDIHIWGKLIKTEVYKKAVNLLGKEKYSTYNINNEDMIGVFSISQAAETYKYIRRYGIFHMVGQPSTSNTSPGDHNNKMLIFFSEVILDLSKNKDKIYVINFILGITPSNEENKLYLIKVLKKIITCKYIEEKYKDEIKEKYNKLKFSIK